MTPDHPSDAILGNYVILGPECIKEVEQHLSTCRECRMKVVELVRAAVAEERSPEALSFTE